MNDTNQTAAVNQASNEAKQVSNIGQRAAKFQKNQILSSYKNQRKLIVDGAQQQQANLITNHIPTQASNPTPENSHQDHTMQMQNPSQQQQAQIPQQQLPPNPVAQMMQNPGPPSDEMMVAAQVVEALREFVAEEVARQIKALAAAVNIDIPPKA